MEAWAFVGIMSVVLFELARGINGRVYAAPSGDTADTYRARARLLTVARGVVWTALVAVMLWRKHGCASCVSAADSLSETGTPARHKNMETDMNRTAAFFSCERHDAFGIGVATCALCDAERSELLALGYLCGITGSLSEGSLDAARWRDMAAVARKLGVRGVVPNAWPVIWRRGYNDGLLRKFPGWWGRRVTELGAADLELYERVSRAAIEKARAHQRQPT